MAEAPIMPFATDAYLADTKHLSTLEHGAYLLLLICLWRSGGRLPNDPRKLARFVGLTDGRFRRVWPILEGFFFVDGDQIGASALYEFVRRQRKEVQRPSVPPSIARAVRQRDGERCSYCGSIDGPFHLDHVVPWSRGGEHVADNLVVACAPCNFAKSDRTPEEWMS